jgi:hypothetical protein
MMADVSASPWSQSCSGEQHELVKNKIHPTSIIAGYQQHEGQFHELRHGWT